MSQILADSFDDEEPVLVMPLFQTSGVHLNLSSLSSRGSQLFDREQAYITTFGKIGGTDYAIPEKRKLRRKKKKQ